MRKPPDLIGKKFGRLEVLRSVLSFVPSKKCNQTKWICRCNCDGRETHPIATTNLVNGRTLSCGCLQIEAASKTGQERNRIIDLSGERFGRLLVISLIPKELTLELFGNRGAAWWCICDCDGKVIPALSDYLRRGIKQSCGCFRAECSSERIHERMVAKWKEMYEFSKQLNLDLGSLTIGDKDDKN